MNSWLRFRRRTAMLAIGWALLSLILGVYGQVIERRALEPPILTTSVGGVAIVSTASPQAAALGVESGQRVLSVDGVPTYRWYRERGWERVLAGRSIAYRLEDSGSREFEVQLLPRLRGSMVDALLVPTFAALALVGLVFLFVGFFVWRLRPLQVEAWAFLLFSCVIASAMFGAVRTYDAPLGYERMVLGLPLIGATMFHLFTVFPSEPIWAARYPHVRWVAYAAAAAVAPLLLLERATGSYYGFVPLLSFGIASVGVLAGLGVLVYERWRMRDAAETASADLVLVGVLGSFLPVAIFTLAQLFLPLAIPTSLAMVWFVGFPISIGYGIVRGQLFEARAAARSPAAYGAATLGITGLFALLIAFAQTAFRQFNENASSPYFAFGFLFVAILAFYPLRNRLQALVDRVFDRDRAAHRKAVREISEAMVSMLSLNEISERLLLTVTQTMAVERAMVLLLERETRSLQPSAWRGEWGAVARGFEIDADHPIGKHLWMRRQELTRADFEETTSPETRARCQQVFDVLGVRLLVPILFGVDLLGVIAVGGRIGGDSLGADERQLLRTLANQSAIAIENAQAFDEIAKLNETLEARVEERTRELRDTQTQLMQSEKMRSLGQLVAGVAHELNNPIGFVHANLQLLEGYIQRLLHAQETEGDTEQPYAAIRKLLARSREGTERVKKIVVDLRTFSRMDQAELADADLNDEIERTLGLMEPRFKVGVRVERDFGALPRVRCYPAQLNQVFMNLLMNSCDAMDCRGSIRIRTRSAPGGVLLQFEDDGPGIPEPVRERIFEPFFTTKPVGQGTGLGLSISHGIVERHGGTLAVECPDDGGTIFRLALPLAPPPAPASA